ncbi:protein-(glutamine-N5) methyltransferase, release factor-specific [Candidatus Wirthbacteria bacterium CG2_30_54_11]|uniref:Release factor glutamine methyltransferase n=1 Tax=Candidatus Wirthbacteria bacterium CG2_30_54_11 TaxID=1817892 RepID=A0A1J5IVE4_9BACT|nr:MAG: protein-(glutamine-N5) methyltransferase, release factor-specific [Candidatus Wirthbacteria bacterium CG2_30_54_11]
MAQSAIQLAQVGIKSARLDAELLLMSALNISREKLITRWTDHIHADQLAAFQLLLARRLKREPLAYITGNKEFYGMKFLVDKRVLIPRPETEILIERTLHYVKQWEFGHDQLALVDVGTGCGNIAISIAKTANFVKIFATDTSPEALEVARINASLQSLDQNISFLLGDLLAPLPQPVNIIIANLPYISESKYEGLEPEITQFEPREAFVSGVDGLDHYRHLLAQTPQFLLQNGIMLLEIDPEQVPAMRALIFKYLPQSTIEVLQDGQHLDRTILVKA